ncbi:MAG: 23S rRNA (uracil(1939)-C(5))-methyltransferase RlmD, partial [Oscillospiraceae bacterium]
MNMTTEILTCPVYKKCGGCQLQNLSYKEQLSWKQRLCIRHLMPFGHVEEIIGMETPYHYRNKVQAAFGLDRAHNIISGIYQSSTHKIVPVNSCLTEDVKADQIIVSVRRLIKAFKLSVYDEMTGKGFLRHVLVKRGFSTGEIMVVLVCGTPVFTAKKHFVEELLKLHPDITTIVMNINDRTTSMLLGRNEKNLYGSGTITDILCGCKFRISAKSFYQINPIQTEILYEKAIEFAGLTGAETVLDTYCGIGTIGIIAAKKAGQVIGVEVNGDAVKDAISNARVNSVKNIRFYEADAGKFMTDVAAEGEKC